MFAHDIWLSRIEYLTNAIDFNKKDKTILSIRNFKLPLTEKL